MIFSQQVDQFLRDHPWLFLLALMLLTALVTVLLVGQSGGSEVLYKTF